jgi:hypothetical protein
MSEAQVAQGVEAKVKATRRLEGLGVSGDHPCRPTASEKFSNNKIRAWSDPIEADRRIGAMDLTRSARS